MSAVDWRSHAGALDRGTRTASPARQMSNFGLRPLATAVRIRA